MALDPIKTQVLILHSEQSTLDTLSSGIDDRYTVHCATSGTEALNTLGDTPIHVIVSAQELPGMSGVEALREAKKRSPETIGILLAGSNDAGLEALVGDKEIFKIVRGGISSEELVQLIDNATQQMRLLALAESANDTAAAPDETGEHIVMETSENGSTIISDGTASLPKLDAKKISANQAVGADAVEILVLSKDEDFVATIKESSRGMHDVRCATTLAQAEEALAKNAVGVAVIDAAMVGTKVEKLTVHLRNRKQRLVTIVAGRRDDGEMLMDLINRGRVYRFLLKPVSPGRARLAVEASVKHHLEAPDAAFKLTAAAAAPAAKPAAKAVPPAKPKSPAKTPDKADKPPQNTASSTASATTPETAADAIQVSADDGLSMPFDADESGLFETFTGYVGKIGDSFKSDDKPAPEKQADKGPAEPPPGDTDSSPFTNPKLLAVAATVLLAIVAGGVWTFTGRDDAPPVDSEQVATTTDSPDVVPTPAPAEPREPAESMSADDLLDEARLARDAGQIIYPAGGSALDFYVRAAQADPQDATIAAELATTIDQAFTIAETAMLERRASDAASALDRVRTADSDNPRLGFLSAQLEQMQLRRQLDDARSAIRDARFQDAQAALTAANALDVVDRSEIDAVAAELSTALSAQRVEDVLAQAAERMEQGLLIEPANDNARYFYELVLSNEPGNAVAQQGLVVVASKLVLQARTEIDGGAFDEAEALLDEARLLDPDNADLQAATTAVSDARSRIAADARRQRQAREAAAQAEADRLAALQAAEEQRRALAAAAAAEKLAAPAQASGDELPAAADDMPAYEPADTEVAALEVPQLEPEYRAPAGREVAEPTRGAADSPVAVSSLTRTRYVAPKYPRSAERRGQSGWVDVVFVVMTDGSTSNIEIIGSEPGELFVNAATRAIERWEFEPVVENGQLVEKRAGVRMMFAIE